jgi:hypothetical protein
MAVLRCKGLPRHSSGPAAGCCRCWQRAAAAATALPLPCRGMPLPQLPQLPLPPASAALSGLLRSKNSGDGVYVCYIEHTDTGRHSRAAFERIPKKEQARGRS